MALSDDDRFVYQLAEEIEHQEILDSVAGTDSLRRLEGPAARKDRETTQQVLFGVGQKIVAPVDQRTERLLAGERCPATARQQAQAVVKSSGDLIRREHPDTGRRE